MQGLSVLKTCVKCYANHIKNTINWLVDIILINWVEEILSKPDLKEENFV